MSDIEKVRVVPSGKIYRQMFEAQALLHHQLSQPKTQGIPKSQGLPLINTSRETSAQGILNSRQKNWLNGLPFDIYTENPVLYKQHSNYIHAKKERTQSPAEKSLVQALPETIVLKQHSAGILERLDNSRRVRHDAAVEELSHELNIIASKLEDYIVEVTQTLFEQLEKDDAEIETLFQPIQSDKDILQFIYKRLENLWYQVREHLPKRLSYIKELDDKFHQVEDLRSIQVRQLFLKYYQIFEKISYRGRSELQRMMDNVTQMINQTLLSNRMNYTNIYVQLMIANIEKERKLYNYWTSRVEFWKDVNIEQFLDQFREYLTSEEVLKPCVIEELMENMVCEHTSLNDQYKQLLNALRDLHPPKCIPKLLEQWFEQTQVVKRGMLEAAGMYVLELERKHEGCMKKCTEKSTETKSLLIMNHFCCPEMADVLTNEFSPWIQGVQSNFAQIMAELKDDLDKEFNHTNNLITNLFIYLQSVAKLWQTHEAGLGHQEQSLHENLQGHRGWHNEQNQKREDKLDSILDEMRQGANEGILNSLLNHTKNLLTNIHISYQEFYTDQVKIVKTYPDMVGKQLAYYEENICTFFKLKKVEGEKEFIPKVEVLKIEESEITDHHDSGSLNGNGKPDEPISQSQSQKSLDSPEDSLQVPGEQNGSSRNLSKSPETDSKKVTPEIQSPADDVDDPEPHVEKEDDLEKPVLVEDDKTSPASSRRSSNNDTQCNQPSYLVTDAGTTYLVLDEEEKQEDASVLEARKENLQHLYIADEFVTEIKLQIRMNFLNHLDSWIAEAKKNSEHATMAKIEELDAEFSLRTQLHLPRAKRIEQDIYNVRAGELLLHSNRVDEHCLGVEQALSDIKSKFLSIKEQQEKMMGEFHNEIELMEPAFLNITKSGRLVTLRNQMSKQIQKLMVNIRTSLRKFRVQLDQALQTVRESNASLVQNFKLFSDGGNFCPQEVSQFHDTIEELSKIIDDNEGMILVEMEGMEAIRFDQASRITIEFEDRFKNHIFDLLFMETVARWLTNTQVQIKTQVAKNNTSSKDISNIVSTLRRNIETCEVPNPDITKVDPSEIAEMFMDSLVKINARAKYLKCLKTNEEVVTVETPNQVAFSSEIPNVSKPGKVMLEDGSVGMIKSILRSQKIETIEETPESTTDGDEEMTEAENQENDNELSPTTKTSKKTMRKSHNRFNKRHIIINHSTKVIKLKLNFGEFEVEEEQQDAEEETTDFLGLIKQLVQNTFVSVGAIAEDYYRQKGSRPITRPQVLQETYESCAETVGDKLVSYYAQAKEYLLRCLAEFHCQLEELERLAKRIPPLLFRSLLQRHMDNLDEEFSQWENTFQNSFKHFEQKQQHNSHLLQPNLGHPQKAPQLQQLNEGEITRHEKFNTAIEKQFGTLQKISITCSESFLQEMVRLSEKLLLQFDELLVSSEVVSGKIDPFKIKPVPDPEPEKEKADPEKKRRNKWLGVSFVELYAKTPFKSPFKKKQSPLIFTHKNILPQQSTFQSRNDAYQVYASSFERRIASVEQRKKKLLHAEEKWMENWKTSVENIQQLFA